MEKLEVSYTIAEDGQEAMDKVSLRLKKGKLVDLIFMKLIIPGMSGFEAAKEIRKVESEYKLKQDENQIICGCCVESCEGKKCFITL